MTPDPPRIPAWIQAQHGGRPGLPWSVGGRAFVSITVTWGESRRLEDFLIDTGASRTILGTMAAVELLRGDYFLIDFDRDPQRVDVGGIGGLVRCVPRQFDLSFRTETGEPFELRAPILIPEMVDAPDGRPPRHTPSLLGRDLLGGGALTLAWRLPVRLHLSNMPSGVDL